MSSNKKQTITNVEIVDTAPAETVALNSTAYGISRDEQDRWSLVRIKYDIKANQAKLSEVLVQDDKELAREQFRLFAAKEILYNEEQ